MFKQIARSNILLSRFLVTTVIVFSLSLVKTKCTIASQRSSVTVTETQGGDIFRLSKLLCYRLLSPCIIYGATKLEAKHCHCICPSQKPALVSHNGTLKCHERRVYRNPQDGRLFQAILPEEGVLRRVKRGENEEDEEDGDEGCNSNDDNKNTLQKRNGKGRSKNKNKKCSTKKPTTQTTSRHKKTPKSSTPITTQSTTTSSTSTATRSTTTSSTSVTTPSTTTSSTPTTTPNTTKSSTPTITQSTTTSSTLATSKIQTQLTKVAIATPHEKMTQRTTVKHQSAPTILPFITKAIKENAKFLKKKNQAVLIAIVVPGVLVVMVILAALYFKCKHKKKRSLISEQQPSSAPKRFGKKNCEEPNGAVYDDEGYLRPSELSRKNPSFNQIGNTTHHYDVLEANDAVTTPPIYSTLEEQSTSGVDNMTTSEYYPLQSMRSVPEYRTLSSGKEAHTTGSTSTFQPTYAALTSTTSGKEYASLTGEQKDQSQVYYHVLEETRVL